VVFHGLSIDHPPSVVMTDDTPFATAFHAAAPKGHRRMKGETHEKFEIISQPSRENWLHHTVAVRHSDSYFDCDISGAWLHVIGAKPLKIKSWLMATRLGVNSFSRFQGKLLYSAALPIKG